MEYEAGASGEFQRSTRMPLDAVVRLHFEGTVAYQNGFAANVSATGMFVKHPAPPPVGTSLVFEFNLGSQRKPVQGTGEVVWVRDRYLGPGQPAGIGIRFRQVDAQSRDHIAEALFEFLERSLAEDSYLDPARIADEIGAEPEALADLAPPAAPAPPRIDLGSVPRLPTSGGEMRSEPPSPSRQALFTPSPATASAPPGAAPERQPFAVFSSLDSADARTAAIVREALRDEAPPVLPAAGAARVKSSGPSPWLWIVPAIAVAGVAGWFAWQKWGAPEKPAPAAVAAAPAEPARPQPEPLSAEPSPGTLAEAVGVDPSARSAAANPPISQDAAAIESEPSDVEAARESAATSAPAAEPAEAAPASPVAEPLPAAPGPAAATTPARSLTALALAESAGGAELTLVGDGAFAAGAFSYSEIGGDNPRVLIKLRGMETPYRGASAGANRLVRGVRTGYHVTGRGNEVHVVVDLVAPAAKVEALEPVPTGLVLRLAAR